MLATPAAATSGQEAVQKAADQGALSAAEAPAEVATDSAQTVRVVGSKVFVLSQGTWVDTSFDPDKMKTTQVSFLSDDYFKLSQADPELASAFSLGSRVIAISGGTAYEVVEEGTPLPPVDVPPTSTPEENPEVMPAPTITPFQPPSDIGQPRAPGGLRCSAGLAPLALAPILGAALLKRKR
jgi:hypothetical protein